MRQIQINGQTTVHIISQALQKLNQEGAELDEQAVGALSSYLRQHINRFGEYQLDLTPDLARDPLQIWAVTMTDARLYELAESATWFFNKAAFFRHSHCPYL